MKNLRLIAVAAILGSLLYVVFNPALSYGPVARSILFLLASLMIAILVGAEATTQFKLKLPGFVFVTSGAAALCFGGVYALYWLAKPDIQVGIYNVYDEDERAVNLSWDGAYQLPPGGPVQVTHFHARNTLIVVFPEQVATQELRVRKTTDGPEYVGTLSYTRSQNAKLVLGKDLKARGERP